MPAAGTRRAHAGRMSGNERREQLLDVAAQLVIDHGIDAVTMEGVAAAAGVSKGLGYAYFANRSELLRALLAREIADLEQRYGRRTVNVTDYEERIRIAVTGWLDAVEERGLLLGPLLQARGNADLREARDSWVRAVEHYYARLAEKEYGLSPDKAVAAAAILMAGLNGIIDRWVNCGDDRTVLEEAYIRIAVDGVRSLAADHPT